MKTAQPDLISNINTAILFIQCLSSNFLMLPLDTINKNKILRPEVRNLVTVNQNTNGTGSIGALDIEVYHKTFI